MNLVHSQLTERKGGLYADFGPASLRIPDSVLAARPSLRGYAGKSVIAGLRPEDIEDAAFAPSANGSGLEVDVALAEAMGAELIAHFPVAARPLVGESMRAVHGADGGPEDSAGLTLLAADSAGEAMITARLSPRSTARTGARLRVALDAERLHFFDPETEDSIW
jgi:multiple sugar transport system ATP-binding protein